MTAEVHVGDIGTIFRVTLQDGTTAVDVSSATTKQLLFEKPDGTLLTKTATFYTDGTDGIIQYTTISGDLSIAGQWQVQGYIVLTTGTWHSEKAYFVVHPNLT